jgi:hypothetical protein
MNRLMNRWTAALVLPLVLAGSLLAFENTKTPVSPKGTRAVVDLPGTLHCQNTTGYDRLGLCVFTSGRVAGRFQNIPELEGFQSWMERQPGGGTPDKFAKMLEAYCRQKGIGVPPYVQHTGGDVSFLELCFKTGRAPCMTYCGVDNLYRGPIAHMVNGAHMDDDEAAIIDNNRPGVWVWMTPKQFVNRWKGFDDNGRDYRRSHGGGWAYVFLGPPPNPHADGVVPDEPIEPLSPQPVPPDERGGRRARPCPGPFCPVNETAPEDDGWVLQSFDAGDHVRVWKRYDAAGRLVWVFTKNGFHRAIDNNSWAAVPEAVAPAGIRAPKDNFAAGVDAAKLGAAGGGFRYWLSGVEVSREKALAAVAKSLTDDSSRYFLSVVGGKEKKAEVLKAFGSDPRFLVQVYPEGSWQVTEGRVKNKVTFQTSRAAGGKVLGTGEDTSVEAITKLIADCTAPKPKVEPVAPKVEPKADPHKDECPADCPCKRSDVPGSPKVPCKQRGVVWLAVLAGGLMVATRRK